MIGVTRMVSVCILLFLASGDTTPALIRKIAVSGRALEIATPFAERLSPNTLIAPGPPPLLSFRLMDGQSRRRYNNLDLVLDDAGH